LLLQYYSTALTARDRAAETPLSYRPAAAIPACPPGW